MTRLQPLPACARAVDLRAAGASRRPSLLRALAAAGMAATLPAAPAVGQDARCANPQTACGARVEARCLETRLGAGSLAAASAADAACQAQFGAYRDCLAEIAEACGPGAGDGAAPRPSAGCDADLERRLWEEVKSSNDPGELSIFVESCPDSPFALVARRRLDAAAAPAPAPPGSTPDGAQRPTDTAPTHTAPTHTAPTEADIRAAQTELRRLRLYRGGVDGDWGPGSQAALRAFQRDADRPVDGRLTAEALAALKAAPTPAGPAVAGGGYVGVYRGTWRDHRLGVSGRSTFTALAYDPATGALRARMSTEYQGVVSTGVMTGRLTLADGGELSGELRAPDGTGWRTSLRLNPTSSFDVVTGTYRSEPLPGAFGVSWGVTTSGPFETRRVQ